MNVCHYNHDLKFIVVYGKDSKALIYYITNYITYGFINQHWNSKNWKKTYYKSNSKDHLQKNHCLIICSFNTIGYQQELLVIWWNSMIT